MSRGTYERTLETRKKLSDLNRGKRHTEETRQKMSESQRGKKKHSEEFKTQVSERSLGNQWGLKDGRTLHPQYGRWSAMMARCYNPNDHSYPHYGGRGITVCEEWHNPWDFFAYLEALPTRRDGETMDRINNDGDYEPGNIRWADPVTQITNRSRK